MDDKDIKLRNAKYNKTYYDKNKKTIISHLGQKVLCYVCNQEMNLGSTSTHLKTLRHKRNLEKLFKHTS